MAQKIPPPEFICDFETATTIDETTTLWQNFQTQLFLVSNPYMGNKRKIINDIANALVSNKVEYESVLDLFGGSGVVSLFMKLIGKKVHYNDLLTSSFYNGLAFVENRSVSLTEDEIDFLREHDNSLKNDFVRKNFTDRFLPEEALFLDNYRANASELGTPLKESLAILSVEQYVMEHCYLGGRLNKGQILANIEHRLGHARNKGNVMKFKLKRLPLFSGGAQNCTATNLDADTLLSSHCPPIADLLYLDPPYGSSQSDYAQMFRFCEEYIYGQSIDSLPHIKDASKKFVQSKDYELHFRELLQKCHNYPTWAISYSESSFSSIDGIMSILRDFRKNITRVSIDHEYRYRKDKGKVVEYLIICQR